MAGRPRHTPRAECSKPSGPVGTCAYRDERLLAPYAALLVSMDAVAQIVALLKRDNAIGPTWPRDAVAGISREPAIAMRGV